MKNYNCNNFTYYKYYETPTLSSLINYIDNNIIDFDEELETENMTNETYLNSINHPNQ